MIVFHSITEDLKEIVNYLDEWMLLNALEERDLQLEITPEAYAITC